MLVTTLTASSQEQAPMVLQYDRPADFFEESLPIGNGKLGALVYGGTDDNIIYLNDITLWTGKPVDKNLDADAHQWIPKIREALFNEDYQLADSLIAALCARTELAVFPTTGYVAYQRPRTRIRQRLSSLIESRLRYY